MSTITLNLTRKWRSRTFNEIVGQPLSVKMLKNSLYVGHYFPVYLFAGQRGCGKTTTARVFAAAVNCQKLDDFRQKPKEQLLPCLECASCKAMQEGKHPDFIEMDAASHTGVDNVREIIEAASLLPILGTKKIYLIDEAHMLSKAAFNAFLKILEEPPSSVIFIMATTDPHKIPETVRSRCFQLFFKAVVSNDLLNHLQAICVQETIKADDDALLLLIKESEGSVRDAMNMLEQVRFSHSVVTKKAVHDTLGYLDEEIILDLVTSVIDGRSVDIIHSLKKNVSSNTNAQSVWHALQEMLRALLWAKYDVKHETYEALYVDLKRSAATLQSSKINELLGILFEYELVFLKSTAQVGMLEMVLMMMIERIHQKHQEKSIVPVDTNQFSTRDIELQSEKIDSSVQPKTSVAQEVKSVAKQEPEVAKNTKTVQASEWDRFVASVDTLQEPILVTLFRQAKVIEKTAENDIKVSLPQNLLMFEDTVAEHKDSWEPLLHAAYGEPVSLSIVFDGTSTVVKKKVEPREPVRNIVPEKKARNAEKLKGRIDISDKEKWRTANALVDAFGGTVTEITEVNNE